MSFSLQSKISRFALVFQFVGLVCGVSSASAGLFFTRTNTTPKANAAVGRYLYLGDAPRFAANELELYASKMGLTLRVKAWVSTTKPAQYETLLLQRWKKIYDAFQSPTMSFEPLKSYSQVESTLGNSLDQSWLKVAGQYAHHVLEDSGINIYAQNLDSVDYKNQVLLALLRYYLQDPSLEIADGVSLAEQYSATSVSSDQLEQSSELFFKHFQSIYTADASHGPGYQGYLTFVYPIAADVSGPFLIPAEGEVPFVEDGFEARWWSNIWGDDYGGFPFLMLTDGGVAFHGPITYQNDLDVWFLIRDFVSHGCLRLNDSDIMELRELAPPNLIRAANETPRLPSSPVYIMDWPDVADWQSNGQLAVVDVNYYEIPYSMPNSNAAPYLGAQAQSLFRQQHYTKFDNQLPSKNEYHKPMFWGSQESLSGLPIYEFQNGQVERNGFYNQSLPIHVFDYRGMRLIQYREAGVNYVSGFNDDMGQYPPGYFVDTN